MKTYRKDQIRKIQTCGIQTFKGKANMEL